MYKAAIYSGLIVGGLGALLLAVIITDGHGRPGTISLAVVVILAGWGFAGGMALARIGARILDDLAVVRAEQQRTRALIATLSLSSPPTTGGGKRTPPQRSGRGQQQRPSGKRGRGRRTGGDDQEPADGQQLWGPGDTRWQEDVAEAARIGRELGPPSSS